ncbi:8649_t:CDS:2 [Funneliformis mosseae]|uniref:8649_t:CDS:1 n=1 Tax=Funneliformis mosseae TaxID=27381 RepID=A0A9N9G7J4_FUNMO|nr:8649_t:CDS:2 [Funneliformis mosseae]
MKRLFRPSVILLSGLKECQGPAILIFNYARFMESDFKSLMQIRVGGKQDNDTKIGKHELGFNSCYHFTDVPDFISGDFIAFLDPQEKYLNKRGTIGSLPRNGISEFTEQDQLIRSSNYSPKLNREFTHNFCFFEVETVEISKYLKLRTTVVGAQRDPEDPQLMQYARQYRLRLLGCVAEQHLKIQKTLMSNISGKTLGLKYLNIKWFEEESLKEDITLNRELGEEECVDLRLAKYSTMSKK